MSNFALDVNSSAGDIISSLNYALVNIGSIGANVTVANTLVANTTTGQITNSSTGIVVSYLYEFINIRYATSSDGSTGFSTSPTNATYYGVRNSQTSTASSNPADYIWYAAAGGFGTTKFLFYKTYGGYQITFAVATTAPDSQYRQTVDATAIDLAVITSTAGTPGANGVTASTNPGVISFLQNTSGTYTANTQSMSATFVQGSNIAYANITATLSTSGNVSITPTFVDPSINVTTLNANTSSLVINFTQSNTSAVTTGLINVQSYPVAVASTTGGANIVQGGSVVTTVATPPTLLITYPQGQYVIQGNGGAYTPPAVANVVTIQANVQAVRSGNLLAAVTQNVQYFTANGNYNIVSNTSTAYNANLLTISSSYNTQYNAYQNISYTDGGGTASNFISVALIVNGSAGNVGPAGTRGPIPLAYIVTDADPTTATNTQLTSWFQQPRTNTVPPIGMGLSPLNGDTAQFFYPNVASQYGGTTYVATYNGSAWSAVNGQVVSGNVIYTGSITADQMNVNSVYALKVASTNATVGNLSSNGFWLDSSTGSARFAGTTSIGNNLIVGTNTQIGGNLNVGTNAIVGNNAIIGGNVVIGSNVFIGNSLTVGYGATIGSVIIAGSLGPTTVGYTNLIGGAVGNTIISAGGVGSTQLAAASVDATKIVSQTITAAQIAANTITAGQIAAGTITAGQIAANTISTNNLQAGSITTDKLAANLFIVNNIQSVGAVVGSYSSTGYWLQANTGNAYFAGNVNIGNNLTVANLITAGTINANVITTNQLQVNSATQNIYVADDPAVNSIAWVNGNTNPASPYYYWPNNTRGFGVSGGAAIIPTTTGNINGSKITVQYQTTINSSNSQYNLVELWKTGSSSYYSSTYNQISKLVNIGSYTTYDIYVALGNNGTAKISYDGGATWTAYVGFYSSPNYYTPNIYTTEGVVTATGLGTSSSIQVVGYTTGATQWQCLVEPPNASAYFTQINPISGANGFNIFGSLVYNAGTAYGGVQPTFIVGSGGQIFWSTQPGLYNTWYPLTPTVPVVNDLYGIGADRDPLNSNTTNTLIVVVGTGGIILKGAFTGRTTPSGTSWSQQTSGTAQNLNAVSCTTSTSTSSTGGTWVAVGNNGTILSGDSTATNWTICSSPTTVNLHSVAYGNGVWIAVGDNGTVITSTNGTTWSLVTLSTPTTRNLYTVAYGSINNRFVVGGDALIMYMTPSSIATNTLVINDGANTTSALTRLQYYGSYANVNIISLPPGTQQIGNAQISGTYTDINYTAGQTVTYYLVLGSLNSTTVYTTGPSLTVTEYKR